MIEERQVAARIDLVDQLYRAGDTAYLDSKPISHQIDRYNRAHDLMMYRLRNMRLTQGQTALIFSGKPDALSMWEGTVVEPSMTDVRMRDHAQHQIGDIEKIEEESFLLNFDYYRCFSSLASLIRMMRAEALHPDEIDGELVVQGSDRSRSHHRQLQLCNAIFHETVFVGGNRKIVEQDKKLVGFWIKTITGFDFQNKPDFRAIKVGVREEVDAELVNHMLTLLFDQGVYFSLIK